MTVNTLQSDIRIARDLHRQEVGIVSVQFFRGFLKGKGLGRTSQVVLLDMEQGNVAFRRKTRCLLIKSGKRHDLTLLSYNHGRIRLLSEKAST